MATVWRGIGVLVGAAVGVLAGLGLKAALSAGIGWTALAIEIAVAASTLLYMIVQPFRAPGWFPAGFFRIRGVVLDWLTGTFVLHGGIGGNSNLNPGSTGFNLGNFAFLRAPASDELVANEAGHTLNLAAWGCVVHIIGAVDENVINHGADAYTEWMAEGNVPLASRSGNPVFLLWGAR